MEKRRTRLSRVVVGAAAVAVALAVGLLAASPALAAPDKVSIDSVTVAPGEQGTVNLEALDIASPGLGAWTIDIVYNPSVVTPMACTAEEGGLCNQNFAPNTVRIIGASAAGLLGDTTLGSITFRCDTEASSTLALGVQVFADATRGRPQPISADVQNGAVNCVDVSPPSTRVPTATPVATDEEPEPTATEPVVTGLPDSGMGGGSDGGALGWLIAASVSAIFAASAGFATWRLSARRA